jgi:hypothetical protein
MLDPQYKVVHEEWMKAQQESAQAAILRMRGLMPNSSRDMMDLARELVEQCTAMVNASSVGIFVSANKKVLEFSHGWRPMQTTSMVWGY